MSQEKIHRAETVEELKVAIIEMFGEDGIIKGRKQEWTTKQMLSFIDNYPFAMPTREYGIRQQLIYITQ